MIQSPPWNAEIQLQVIILALSSSSFHRLIFSSIFYFLFDYITTSSKEEVSLQHSSNHILDHAAKEVLHPSICSTGLLFLRNDFLFLLNDIPPYFIPFPFQQRPHHPQTTSHSFLALSQSHFNIFSRNPSPELAKISLQKISKHSRLIMKAGQLFLSRGIVQILQKGRMGNTPIPEAWEPQELTTATVHLQNAPQDDPLRHYLKHHSTFNVKTLADVNTSSLKAALTKRVQPLPLDSSKEKENGSTPSGRIETNKIPSTAPNGRFSHDLTSSIHLCAPRRMTNLEQQFKSIAISQETFIKVQKESPEAHYQFREKIGEGSYGQVFRAVHKKTLEERAIKVLKLKLMKEEKRKEFLAQMTLLSKLNHPSIITLYQLFAHSGKYYVVMEYCRGGTIVDILDRLRKQSQGLIADIMKQLLSALAYMHSLGMIHRDIKLDNIVFLPSGEECVSIKIIDFGTAVQTPHKIIHNYPIAGTLSYLAPEVLTSTLTEKSDIWSSAVLMYILLTGASPFKGRNQAQTKRNILKKTINYDEQPLKDVSEEAKSLLKLMLNRSIHDRISALDALQHPWLGHSSARSPISSTNLQQLSLYYRRNNFISLIESYLALRRITQEERQRLAEMFTSIDSDGNGVISREELVNTFQQQAGVHVSREQVEAIAQSVDINDSGKIDFNEFIIAMYDRRKLYLRESLGEAFEHFDVDHTGYIELEELREMLKGGDQAEVEYFFSVLDKDSDARISRQEFIDYLTQE